MAKLLFLQNLDYEFLGPMYISSMLKDHGHECELAIGQTFEDFEERIEKFQPDLVGFSIMSGSHYWGKNLAGKIKEKYGIKNIFGGAHPTFFKEFIEEPEVDYLVRGEGEETMKEIMDRIDGNECFHNTPNLSFSQNNEKTHNPLRNLRPDLDEYPFPDRSLYNDLDKLGERKVRNVITSRGCPFHCSFCFEDAMRDMYKGKGKYVRIREIDRAIEECKRLLAETNAEIIYFADDVFGMKKQWLYDFLEVYKKEVNVEFICLVRADIVASDEQYAYKLAEAGCKSVFFGIESGNEQLRNKVLKKQLTDDQILKAAKLLHDVGITFRTYNIVGLPDETLEDAFSTVELNIKIKADYPWCSIFSPFPGTELTDYAFNKGYLGKEFDYDSLDKSFFLETKLEIPHKREIQNLQKFFQTAVLWPWTYPLIKRLIKLPSNVIFRAWFGFIYFLVYIKSEKRNFWETFKFAIKNYKHVLVKE
ncbi:B12-binding domain-containing radical SAM protein [Aquimarina algiphila]|uniref:B12-binding domain-containing radical SAM protein n=1 Tax=Aquimarina algiphila TaxID=2047982 RepID=A0A554VEM8_9FLAO|nr:radical SAM protein [Aquimarina algiphila]TSE05534.1 B12-binding domain-containing radical SAM protein [Aquimarina algiphila]